VVSSDVVSGDLVTTSRRPAAHSPEAEPPQPAPEPVGLSGLVARFDAAVDRRVDRLRGNPVLDRVMYTASDLGDFSLVWHLISAGRALAPDRRLVHAVRVAAVLGVESGLVNGPIKSLFRRHRPVWEHERPYRLRVPKTSSFPSGHASSAATAAGVLSERDPLGPLYYGVGAVVAASRVYVRHHHASDVVAGALLGAVLARAARRLWRLPG
jgi:membrane-associated phospholipid phosphatase